MDILCQSEVEQADKNTWDATITTTMKCSLVVGSTHLIFFFQTGNLPQIEVKIEVKKNFPN